MNCWIYINCARASVFFHHFNCWWCHFNYCGYRHWHCTRQKWLKDERKEIKNYHRICWHFAFFFCFHFSLRLCVLYAIVMMVMAAGHIPLELIHSLIFSRYTQINWIACIVFGARSFRIEFNGTDIYIQPNVTCVRVSKNRNLKLSEQIKVTHDEKLNSSDKDNKRECERVRERAIEVNCCSIEN